MVYSFAWRLRERAHDSDADTFPCDLSLGYFVNSVGLKQKKKKKKKKQFNVFRDGNNIQKRLNVNEKKRKKNSNNPTVVYYELA